MNARDIRKTSETRIDEHAVLERVINGGGIPYSCLIIDGEEFLSCPTDDEKGMVEYYHNNKGFIVR